ncbi:MAG: glutathione S-transferase family protein [Thermoleophilaceae bacterium]
MAKVVLWHIEFSNFNEKARWALDWKRVPHKRRAPPNGTHVPLALVLTRGAQRTFPVVRIDGQSLGDSTAIIAELEHRFPEPPLYPDDPAERRHALELEDFFDENYGHEVRRLAFFHLLEDDEAAAGTARELVGAWAVPLVAGLRSFLWTYYGISEESAKRAKELILAGFDRIEAERAGGDYLVGDRFSIADLAAAALAGPLLAPPEFPWRPKGEPAPGLLRARGELMGHPAADWILRVYAKHRLPAPTPSVAAPA